jgi:DnaJ domain
MPAHIRLCWFVLSLLRLSAVLPFVNVAPPCTRLARSSKGNAAAVRILTPSSGVSVSRQSSSLFAKADSTNTRVVVPDLYEIMCIPADSSPEAIKEAYRTLAKQLHPDQDQGDAQKFAQVNEAYK